MATWTILKKRSPSLWCLVTPFKCSWVFIFPFRRHLAKFCIFNYFTFPHKWIFLTPWSSHLYSGTNWTELLVGSDLLPSQSWGSEGRYLVRCLAQYKCTDFLIARYRGSCGFEGCLDGVMRELLGKQGTTESYIKGLAPHTGPSGISLPWNPALFQVKLDK